MKCTTLFSVIGCVPSSAGFCRTEQKEHSLPSKDEERGRLSFEKKGERYFVGGKFGVT